MKKAVAHPAVYRVQQRRTLIQVLIACLVRGSKTIIPGGTERILPGDSVLVVTADQQLRELKGILEE